MQRSENKVAGRGSGESQLNGFEITHFSDEQDVWIFTQRTAQGRGERACMHSYFAMLDEAVLTAVHELDRVLDRDDVIVSL